MSQQKRDSALEREQDQGHLCPSRAACHKYGLQTWEPCAGILVPPLWHSAGAQQDQKTKEETGSLRSSASSSLAFPFPGYGLNNIHSRRADTGNQ